MGRGSPDQIWPWQLVYEADWLGEGGALFCSLARDSPGQSGLSPDLAVVVGVRGKDQTGGSWEPSQDMNQGNGCPEGLQLTGRGTQGCCGPH